MFSLGGLFSWKSPPLLGLDLGGSHIRVVELSRRGGQDWTLERCAWRPLERGWIVNGVIKQANDLARAIATVVSASGSKGAAVAMGLPAASIMVKKIVVSSEVSGSDLEQDILAVGRQHIPFPLEEVCVDFCPTGARLGASGGQEIVLAAVKKETVEDYQALAEAAGLRLALLDARPFAVQLGLQPALEKMRGQDRNTLTALIEIGEFDSAFHVMQGGGGVYDSMLPIGLSQLIQLISRRYGLSPEASDAKRRQGKLPTGAGAAVLEPFFDQLASEVERALQMFFNNTRYSGVDRAMLAGEAAATAGLAAAIERRTGVPCRVAQPFEGMKMARGLNHEALKAESPAYLAACGLAMRRYPD